MKTVKSINGLGLVALASVLGAGLPLAVDAADACTGGSPSVSSAGNGCSATFPVGSGPRQRTCSYTASGPVRYDAAVMGSALYDIRVDGKLAVSGATSAMGVIPADDGQTVTVYISCDYDHDSYCARLGVAAVSVGDEE